MMTNNNSMAVQAISFLTAKALIFTTALSRH